MVFLLDTLDAVAETVTQARVPSLCAAVPAALHRAAVKFKMVGGEYGVTYMVRTAVPVLPRESVTVKFIVT